MNSLAPSRFRQTKIVATLGPATSTPAKIRALHDGGANVFRMNFSHGSHADHAARIQLVREIERDTGRPIAIMADLQGPKLRLATFATGGVDLVPGQAFRLDLSMAPGDATRVGMPHAEIFAALEPGADLLLDDGRVRLTVVACSADHADTRVVSGNRLSDRKGVNVPGVVLPVSPLTPKDLADLAFALDQGVDWVALSFVQRPSDVEEARGLIAGRAALLSKMEKPQAIEHLDAIVALSDGVMVARGDLGVEVPPEDVPSIQKRIILSARRAGKPVIVATQMLESMVTAPAPTRAEASDVATAIFDGADAIMLSAETASGAYPLESVAIMDRIARKVESDPMYRTMLDNQHAKPDETSADAIAAAARQVSETVDAAAIVTYTSSGATALRAARERPAAPILCLTPSVATSRRMAMAYGVHAVVSQDVRNVADMVCEAMIQARALDLGDDGAQLVITAGEPFGRPGTTNLLRIARIEGVTAQPRAA
ncbi:pyruvate kinase [Sphingobium lactosutens]|uniref:pyruvate kinase n=1 Tax=Sphingobium lactosutens TaxID=522773 RepID=UPI0015B90CD8|nr:pyruvate kinase [Sphingobium lactosutens]NWK94565.1 pyruvate kinase [Sphingobium lactosutens]